MIVSFIIDAGAKALGIPPEVADVAKIGIGLCTGDYISAAAGAVGLAGEVIKDVSDAQKTEYAAPKKSEEHASRGYASAQCGFRGADDSLNVQVDASVGGWPRLEAPQKAALSAEEWNQIVDAPPVMMRGRGKQAMNADGAAPALIEESQHLAKLSQYFSTYNTSWNFVGIKDDVISRADLENILKDKNAPEQAKVTARYFLTRPDKMAAIDGCSGIDGGDTKWNPSDITMRKQNVDAQIAKQKADFAARPVHKGPPTPPPAATTPATPSSPPPTPVKTNPDSPLASDIPDYLKALQELRANHATYDTAVGVRDDLYTRENLQAIVNNPNADAKLKHAAKFLIDHSEYFNRLEMAAGFGGNDGTVALIDVEAEIKRVEADIQKYGVPSKSTGTTGSSNSTSTSTTGSSGSAGASVNVGVSVNQQSSSSSKYSDSGDLSAIINDPTISLEAKIQLILMTLAEREDDETLSAMSEMSTTSQELAGMRAKTKADDEQGQKDIAKKQQNMELLQQRLQRAMERRKQMYDLMSNMSSKFNEMAKTAISNLARA
ncbi:MAG: hypothetical protein ACT4TC_15795 [Myxococcaceae bacterium]